jgi:Outer membrane protein beta-barrel domain
VRRAALAFGALGMTLAPRAGAVEREHHLGIDAGGAMLVMSDKTDVGGALGAHWTYGLTDAFNLMVEAAWSPVALGEKAQGASTPKTRPSSLTDAGVGVGYVLDVLQWVPYAAVLLGGYALTGGTLDGAKILPGASVGLGLDYRFGRSWAAGVAFRQHMLVTEMSTYPSFTQLFARAEYTWGW